MTRYTWRTGVLEALMLVVAIVFAFPFYVLVNLSVRQVNDPTSPLVPTLTPTFENFVAAWNEADLASAIFNSLTVTVFSVVIVVAVSAMASFPLVRMTTRLSRTTYWLVMFGLLLPFQVALIPLYTTIRDLHLLGTTWSLVIFYAGLQVPFSVFLYTGFLRALPRDYEEAAQVDGAGPFTTFWRVVFPMMRPVTGTVIILNAIFVWNDFMTPLLYLSGSGSQTIPVALFSFVGEYAANWPVVFAGLIIGIAPILFIYFLLQKSIIQGFTGG
ncbi:carbohydrate ABC transporter permease [Agromyces mangrovi Wang et al. 2018]|uniref:carbohydrate ABC transporter permease n=1 Tax=Agromyces mangrovi TaxID=1858653 RepID=UPI0025741BDA|nr:carbohydrate ABC transporter permease [Agromyces mangrovi]BDZ64768.1 sugar ABC transporter permease [Agromyces mangrovi]